MARLIIEGDELGGPRHEQDWWSNEGSYHSLSYQDTSLAKLGDSEMPAVLSTMLVRGSWMKSVDTTASLV